MNLFVVKYINTSGLAVVVELLAVSQCDAEWRVMDRCAVWKIQEDV